MPADTPRRSRSTWSCINCQKANALLAQGVMCPAGLREIERAQTDGRWEAAYASQSRMAIPDDFQAALDADTEAHTFFTSLESATRYAILSCIVTAQRPETRQKRIPALMAMLHANKPIHG